MMTFTVFAAGFLMRPLGAIFLGAYVDRVGRRKGLIVTLSLMAIGTILITFVLWLRNHRYYCTNFGGNWTTVTRFFSWC